MENAIEINNLKMTFGKDEVLKGITHNFEKGKVHGIVGNNGSGKTVMMKCICGFLKPTSGTVKVNGKLIGRQEDFPKSLGLIIEAPGFLPHLSGFRNLSILASVNKKINKQRIKDTIRLVGLDPDMKKPVGKYSLGMRQRLGIAQAIMEDPELLVLDEPMNGLDKNGVQEMRELLKGLVGKGKTIILSSHNPADIDALCDTVCEMDGGVLSVTKE